MTGPMAGIALSIQEDRVRLGWRDGTWRDLHRLDALNLATNFEECAAAAAMPETDSPRMTPTPNYYPTTGFADGTTLELVRDGDYHGERTPVMRFHWGDGTWIDMHPRMAGAMSAGLRHYAGKIPEE